MDKVNEIERDKKRKEGLQTFLLGILLLVLYYAFKKYKEDQKLKDGRRPPDVPVYTEEELLRMEPVEDDLIEVYWHTYFKNIEYLEHFNGEFDMNYLGRLYIRDFPVIEKFLLVDNFVFSDFKEAPTYEDYGGKYATLFKDTLTWQEYFNKYSFRFSLLRQSNVHSLAKENKIKDFVLPEKPRGRNVGSYSGVVDYSGFNNNNSRTEGFFHDRRYTKRFNIVSIYGKSPLPYPVYYFNLLYLGYLNKNDLDFENLVYKEDLENKYGLSFIKEGGLHIPCYHIKAIWKDKCVLFYRLSRKGLEKSTFRFLCVYKFPKKILAEAFYKMLLPYQRFLYVADVKKGNNSNNGTSSGSSTNSGGSYTGSAPRSYN